MKVLVYGATGSQAKPVVHQLLKKGHEAVAFTRNAEKATDLKEVGATIATGDMLNYEDVLKASQGIDAIALLVPSFMQKPIEAGLNAIKAAKEVGIKYITWNASGLIAPEKTGNPMLDGRLEIKSALEESGIPYVIFQPTVYAENLLGPWTAPFVKGQNKVAYPVPTDYPMGWLPSSDLAKAIVAALENKDLAGSSFVISGLETLNGNDLAEAFTKGLGRSIEYYAMPPKEFGGIMDKVMGEGAGEGVAAQYQAIWDGHAKPVFAVPMEETLKKLDVEFTPLADWVKSFAFLFTEE